MLHSWGLRPDTYDRLPKIVQQEMFLWWQGKVERDRALNDEARQKQEEAVRALPRQRSPRRR